MDKNNSLTEVKQNDVRPVIMEAVDKSIDLVFLMTDLILMVGSERVYNDLNKLKNLYILEGDSNV